MQFNPLLVLIIGLGLWSAFDYMSRSITHGQAIAAYKESPEYKANLKRLKEDTLAELERTGKIKKKLNGKRCVYRRHPHRWHVDRYASPAQACLDCKDTEAAPPFTRATRAARRRKLTR